MNDACSEAKKAMAAPTSSTLPALFNSICGRFSSRNRCKASSGVAFVLAAISSSIPATNGV